MSFETLPSHNLEIPQFHPATLPTPPVYNTREAITPLLNLAEYLSPTARAIRKAKMAEANYKFRLYSGDPRMKDKFFYMKAMREEQRAKDLHDESRARINKLNRKDDGMPPYLRDRHDRDFNNGGSDSGSELDMNSESSPPPDTTTSGNVSDSQSLSSSPLDDSDASEA